MMWFDQDIGMEAVRWHGIKRYFEVTSNRLWVWIDVGSEREESGMTPRYLY